MNTLTLNVGNYPVSLLTAEHGGESYIALRPLCEALGLSWPRQMRRTQENPQFRCCPMATPSAGGPQEMLCLPVRQVGMWLCTINARRVKPDIRDRLIAFQESLQVVIHDHLTGKLTMDRLQQLEEALRTTTVMCKYLAERLEEVEKKNIELEERWERQDHFAASYAGKTLAARKRERNARN